ncbi:MAG TPA: amino acid adenylation domain-containing protein, partial [Herpetosiphonaceae bacterium]
DRSASTVEHLELPRTPTEELVATIWQQVLGVAHVGVHDNFFSLGGHSLLATQILSRVRETFQVELSLSNLFNTPTVAGMAEQIELVQQMAHGMEAPPIEPVPHTEYMPLSFVQQRLWFLHQIDPRSPTYNIPVAVQLNGPLDLDMLARALNAIVARHEALRTTFHPVDGQPMQRISPGLELELPLVDLSDRPADEQQAEVPRLAVQEARRPFDLVNGPLVRALAFRQTDQQHVLVLTMHHIVADGWSQGVLIRELAILYNAYAAGKPHPEGTRLPELPIQYADYAHWQRAWLRGEVLEAQHAYWKAQLGGHIPVLDLPTDRPRPPTSTQRGAKHPFTFPKSLADALTTLSRAEGTTLFMTLLAALDTLLYRYSGQTDIVVGSPIANRHHGQVESLIGCFINTLVLRADLSGNPSFQELLQRVREVALGAYSHQDLPFEQVVEIAAYERAASRTPLFQVMFILQNAPMPELALGDLTLLPLEVDNGTAKFDLTFELTETADGLFGFIEYNSDLFEAATIARMMRHFQMVLESVVADPAQRIAALPLLDEAERQRVLVEWNATAADYPQDVCLHTLIEQQARRTPDAVALVFEDRQLTYAALNARANQLAHALRARGVGGCPQGETRVAVCMERSIDLVVALLGVLKAGGAYVPLDPDYPQERLHFMLADAQAAVLLTQQHIEAVLPAHAAQVLRVDADWERIARQPDTNPASAARADNLAYMIYTSGSTGQAKGAMNTHQAIVNRLLWMQDAYQLTPADRVLQKTPYSFDVSVWEFFWPLLTGATLVVAKPGGHQDSAYLVDLIARERITTLHFVPSMLQVFLEERDLDRCTSLRRVICSGEALPLALQQRFFARLDAELHNLYGPTEAAVDVTYWACQPDRALHTVPIGKPVANTQIYILDVQMQPVPVGVPGELHIGGVQLARGYNGRPDLTAERFIPDPFSRGVPCPEGTRPGTRPGARLYKTGDLARYREDGTIEFLGRIDQQVKLRGFRVELGEIEAVLLRHPDVREAVVLAREDTAGEKRLVAYVIEQRTTEQTENQEPGTLHAQLRAFLADCLPDYMIPAAFVTLSAFPLTPNGKVDRKALPAPDRSALGLAPLELPRTPTEELIAAIWQQVLGVAHVGVHDNFFSLGGHSLLATQILSRVRETFAVELTLAELFNTPMVAGMAEQIELVQQMAHGMETPPITPVRHTEYMPLSFAQQRLWFLHQIDPRSPTYNIPIAVQLNGPLDLDALTRALNAIVARHEALRTTFHSIDGQPMQRISPSLELDLPLVDLSGYPEAERQPEVFRLAREEARRPFDLVDGPLVRLLLLHQTDQQHALVLTMHHIVSDGWSQGVFIRDLAQLYQAFVAGQPHRLPELPIQYADYALWQRRWLQGARLAEQQAYWKQQLGGTLGVLELPNDHPRPATPSQRGAKHQFMLPPSLADAVKLLSRNAGVTLFMTLLAALDTLLYRYSGQTDIVVGSPIANRHQGQVEGLIGMFVNTLVLRTDLSGNPRFEELLGRVRGVALGAYSHQDLPFEQVVEIVAAERDLSRHPLFQVMLILQNAPMPELALGDLTLLPIAIDNHTTKFDLSFDLTETADGLFGLIEYSTDLFEAATIARIAEHFRRVLEIVVADPAQRIAALPLLDEAERQRVLVEWNATAADYPQDVCLHTLVERQAARTPDAVALVFEDRQFTYAEIDARANQVAHALRTRGVGGCPQGELRVGLCLPRSPELLIGLLGILKAGGCYVPLDPAYPQERLAWIVGDAQIGVLLTTEALAEYLPPNDNRVIRLDADWPTIASGPRTSLGGGDPDTLAYIIYTSGSTGRPKGVQNTHRAIVNRLLWNQEIYPLSAEDRVLQIASFSFDISIWELIGPLLAGAQVIMARPGGQQDLPYLVRLMAERQVTVAHFVPSLLQV